jgi:hypothetical protein
MKQTRYIKTRKLGFYFRINELTSTETLDIPESEFEPAAAINDRAHALLSITLPLIDVWVQTVPGRTGGVCTPFMASDVIAEEEHFENQVLFSYWISTTVCLTPRIVSELRYAVVSGYQKAAGEAMGLCELVRIEELMVEEVSTRSQLHFGPVEERTLHG